MELDQAKEIIMDYFDYDKNNSSLLEILDEGSIDAKARGGYTGVTLNYVWKHILKEKISKRYTLDLLTDLIRNQDITSIFCGNIRNYVFEKYHSDYDHSRYNIEEQIQELEEDYQENHV